MSVLTATVRPAAARAHPAGGAAVVLRAHTGEVLEMDLGRWHDPATAEERDILATVAGPVIDLGCGPGRLVASLASRRVPALGVDSSPAAIALARVRGATVLQRDLFGPLPGEGRWGAVLLFDGNVGIGGDPVRLLTRCRQLAAARGSVVAEVQAPGTGWRRLTAWFERGGERGESFGWAVVGADAVAALADSAGLEVTDLAPTPSGRWFARLQASA